MASFCQHTAFAPCFACINVNPELAQTQAKAALTDPAGLMQSQDDNMKQTPKRQYIAGGNENIYALLFSWTGNAVLSKEMERAYKNQALKKVRQPMPLLSMRIQRIVISTLVVKFYGSVLLRLIR